MWKIWIHWLEMLLRQRSYGLCESSLWSTWMGHSACGVSIHWRSELWKLSPLLSVRLVGVFTQTHAHTERTRARESKHLQYLKALFMIHAALSWRQYYSEAWPYTNCIPTKFPGFLIWEKRTSKSLHNRGWLRNMCHLLMTDVWRTIDHSTAVI